MHVDLVGPFPTDQGFSHILTAIDRTTQWPEAVPLRDSRADTVAKAFINTWIARFGVPEVVTSDRGAQFTSELWNKSLLRLGIMANTTTAYHPQSNGVVERFHRTSKNALRFMATGSKWVNAQPWVLLGLRNAPRDDTKTSTAETLFGTALRVPRMCFPASTSPEGSVQEQLQLARTNVRAFTPAVLNDKKFKHSPFMPKQLREARFVFVRNNNLAKAPLPSQYSGPFPVVSRNWKESTFVLQFPRGKDVVSLSRLKAAEVLTS